MSLTSCLKIPGVLAKLKPLRPRLKRNLPVPLRVTPRTKNYSLVGTAFDYLLRFELQRRAPHAVSERWVAESAVGYLQSLIANPRLPVRLESTLTPHEAATRAGRIVKEAQSCLGAYLACKSPTPQEQVALAPHALRLAKLDEVVRAGILSAGFEQTDPEDVLDLVNLLAVVPFDDLIDPIIMLLNPTFREASAWVGGADADLIRGSSLIDFKVTIKGELQSAYLDQLLGYFLLARRCRAQHPTFPAIRHVGIYFCRHGYLWDFNTETWTANPDFAEVERWFGAEALDVFRGVK